MDAFERFVGINTAHIYLSTNSLLSGSHRLVLNIFIFTDVYGTRRRRVQMSPSVNEKLHGSSSRDERRRDPCGENEQHPQRNGRVSLRRDRHVPHNVVYWISYYVGIIRLQMLASPAAPILAIHVFFWVNGPSSGHWWRDQKDWPSSLTPPSILPYVSYFILVFPCSLFNAITRGGARLCSTWRGNDQQQQQKIIP